MWLDGSCFSSYETSFSRDLTAIIIRQNNAFYNAIKEKEAFLHPLWKLPSLWQIE